MGFTLRGLRKFKDFLIDGGSGLVRCSLGLLPQNSAAVLIKPWCIEEVQHGLESLLIINRPRLGYG
jgi:hypothetical protein